MIELIKKYYHYLIGTIVIGSALAAGLTLQEQQAMIDQQINALPAELKLKTTVDNILSEETVKDLRCATPSNCVDLGDIKRYSYISDVEVPTSSIEIPNGKKTITITEDMSKRKSNAQFFKIIEDSTGSSTWQAKVYSAFEFYKKVDKWVTIENATTTINAFDLQKNSLVSRLLIIKKALADTIYPYSDEGIYVNNASWSTTHDATSGTLRGGATSYVSLQIGYTIDRAFFTFDTSAIGSGNTVNSASVSLYIYYKTSNVAGYSYNVYSSTNSDTIVAGDYDLAGTTAYSTAISHSSISATGYNTWSLNSTGMSAINVTGKTHVSMREYEHDVLNSAPSSDTMYFAFYSSRQSGTSQDPYLTVTYSAGGGTTATPDPGTFINFE